MRGGSIIFCVLVFVHCGWSQGSPVSKKGTITVKKPTRPTLNNPDSIKAIEMPPNTDTTWLKQLRLTDYAREAGVYNKNYDNVIGFSMSVNVGGGIYQTISSRSRSLTPAMNKYARRGRNSDTPMIFEDIRARREDGQMVKLKGFTVKLNKPDLIKAIEMPPNTDTTWLKQFTDYAREAGVYNKYYDNVIGFTLSVDVGGGIYQSLSSQSGSLTMTMIKYTRRERNSDTPMIFEDIRARREDGQVVKLKGFTANVN